MGAATSCAVAAVVALLLEAVASTRANSGQGYAQWTARVSSDWAAWWTWVLGDFTEPTSYKSPLSSLGLLAGVLLAYFMWRRASRFAGTPVSYGFGDRLPWLLGSVFLSLLVSNLLYRDLMTEGQWQPTFVVVASVPAAIVLLYGCGWAVLLTAAILGVATVPPISMLLIAKLCVPLHIPNVIGIVLAMALGGIAACTVCRILPWMRTADGIPQPDPARDAVLAPRASGRYSEFCWTIRRVLCDFSEAQFIGNEWAGGLMIAGACAGFLINPSFAGYGLELLPRIILAQVLASAIGVVLWRQWYRDGGWTATYVPVVSSAPTAVVAFHGNWAAIIWGAVIGAAIGAPTARLLAKPLHTMFHPYIANVTSMAVTTLVVYELLNFIL
ncbi:hypothetical protein BJF84_25965 [Rhodococcus sp. CUA-806]|nr:hypothetical protein BJF84_25965 [Rhodococcus sp. CUA-806]